ncbi:MAG: DNA/RNA nuclease SfsA [Planktomarina sp.]
MRFHTPLVPGHLIRRYKRFLADVRLDDGVEVTAHCANPGAMLGLKDPGLRVWLEPNDDPKRKLNYSWRIADLENGARVGIDTSLPNKLVKDALATKHITELAAYDVIRPEQKYGENSRIDFLLQGDNLPDTYVEVKNVHLWRSDDWAEFPDCVTLRGTKHLGELARMAQAGHRAVMLYVVQHTGCARFKLAPDLDPNYAQAFADARAAGVEVLCYDSKIENVGITLDKPLPVFEA